MHSPRFFGGQEFSKAPLPTQTRDSGAFRHESGALTLIKGPRRCLRLAISTRNPRSPQGESSTFERCCRSMTRIAVEVELSPLPLGYRLANAAATTTMTRHQLGTHRRIHQPPHDRWTASTHHIRLIPFPSPDSGSNIGRPAKLSTDGFTLGHHEPNFITHKYGDHIFIAKTLIPVSPTRTSFRHCAAKAGFLWYWALCLHHDIQRSSPSPSPTPNTTHTTPIRTHHQYQLP